MKEFLVIGAFGVLGVGLVVFGSPHSGDTFNLLAVTQGVEAPVFPDGTLIRSDQNERVYYMENGKKRWIESAEVFRLHGFQGELIRTLSKAEVDRYEEGDAISAQTNIIFPSEQSVLPDLAPFGARDVHLAKLKGRTVIRFTTLFWNKGKQTFQLVADPKQKSTTGDSLQDVFQHVVRPDATSRDKIVGNFLWHRTHSHYHYQNFADYVFELVRPASGAQAFDRPSITQKTTFCLRDDQPVALDLPGAPGRKIFVKCGQDAQGVSVGWADKYGFNLPDQHVDVQDMPPGIYSLSFLVDPGRRFIEERKDNNISTVFLELDVKKNFIRVVAAAAPFVTDRNKFQEGMLIRAGGDGEIYIIHNNHKRWLRTAEIFDSYGLPWDEIYVLAQSIVDVIPETTLVRLKGTEEVYVLNELGYKRHILTAPVFRSYGFVGEDVADINQTEFMSYPASNLIMQKGSSDVYLISGTEKKKIGTIDLLTAAGYNQDAVHVVNEADLNAYTLIP